MSIFHFETRRQPLASPEKFRQRVIQTATVAFGGIAFSLVLGILGYRYIVGLPSWVDSLYNASMILGGMGPVDVITRPAGKVFASMYALYSGVTLLTSVGVFLSPLLHRLLHTFHLEAESG